MKKETFAKKYLGQNFLINKDICKKIIENSNIRDNASVVEIGPGLGALTEFAYKENFKNYILIEKDESLIQNLKEKFPKTKIINLDALKFDLNLYSNQNKIENFTIIGNLPYNVGTLITLNLIKDIQYLENLIFMLQKEVIEKFTAKQNSKEYGITSVIIQKLFNFEIIFDKISPKNFNPSPKVYSSVIKLTPKKEATIISKEKIEKFINFTKFIFNQRRKKLSRLYKEKNFQDFKINLEIFKKFEEKRPQELNPEEIFSLIK